MTDLEFFCPCVPPTKTAQQKRVNHSTGAFFKDKAGQAAVHTLQAVLVPHRPPEPISGLVALSVDVVWPFTAGDLSTKAKRELCSYGLMAVGGKPDLDNWVKSFQDCLVALRFIERDELVCALHVRKFRGKNPGIYCKIQAVGDPYGFCGLIVREANGRG